MDSERGRRIYEDLGVNPVINGMEARPFWGFAPVSRGAAGHAGCKPVLCGYERTAEAVGRGHCRDAGGGGGAGHARLRLGAGAWDRQRA